jgi:hypothetical protein
MRTGLRFAAFTLAFAALSPVAAAALHPDIRSGALDSELGYLTLVCEPIANVSVDGEPKGATPVVKLALPVGGHQITLVSLDGKLKRSLGVKIVSGETTRLRVNLGP